MARKKNPNAVALGRRGGKKTLAKHGAKFFSKLAKKSARSKFERYGSDYFKRIRRGEKPSLET